MKRFLTTVFALCLVASTAMAQPKYGWSVSNSPADPNANTGPVANGTAFMYLWFNCSSEGLSAMETLLSLSPGNILLAVLGQNGFNSFGAGNLVQLGVGGCPLAPVVAAQLLISKNTPLDVCFGGLNVTVDCSVNATPWPHEFRGYSESGTPCEDPIAGLCQPTSVDASSWGSIKSLYR